MFTTITTARNYIVNKYRHHHQDDTHARIEMPNGMKCNRDFWVYCVANGVFYWD